MNRNQLKYFVAAAETRSFTKAAEQYYISQTAVTQQIHLLEEIPKRQICLVTDESKVLSSAAQKLRDALAADASYRPFFCDC